MRQAAKGFNRIVAADLFEISLCAVAVNGMAHADVVESVSMSRRFPMVSGHPIDLGT
jgi:uncharacterized protein YcsI (UPF0317 family)